MCVLKLFSDTTSFKSFAEFTAMPVYSCMEKGDLSGKTGTVRKKHRISFDVSQKEWDDIQGQIEDAIAFLAKWEAELIALITSHDATDAYLDFPLYSRLNGNIVNQNDHLPKALVVLAGRIGLGIEMALYDKSAFLDNQGQPTFQVDDRASDGFEP